MNPANYEEMFVTETPDALFVMSPEVTALHWNRGAETTVGYSSRKRLWQGEHVFSHPAHPH